MYAKIIKYAGWIIFWPVYLVCIAGKFLGDCFYAIQGETDEQREERNKWTD
jgi:hypothetical protein